MAKTLYLNAIKHEVNPSPDKTWQSLVTFDDSSVVQLSEALETRQFNMKKVKNRVNTFYVNNRRGTVNLGMGMFDLVENGDYTNIHYRGPFAVLSSATSHSSSTTAKDPISSEEYAAAQKEIDPTGLLPPGMLEFIHSPPRAGSSSSSSSSSTHVPESKKEEPKQPERPPTPTPERRETVPERTTAASTTTNELLEQLLFEVRQLRLELKNDKRV